MIHFFLDTNVILDFLMDRRPFSRDAAELFSVSINGKIKIYVSAISFNNLYYVLRQTEGHRRAIQLVDDLDSMVTVIDLNIAILRSSLKSDMKDFEDAIQYYSALSNSKIQAIVTRNVKDYSERDLLVIQPDRAVQFLHAK